MRHFLPTLERSRGGGWRAGPGESGRKPASSVVGGSLVAGSGKLHVQEGGFGGARDSPQENHDLRSDLAHCALHLRDGYHDHHRAPLTSRDSSEPDCSPTKNRARPLLCLPFAGTIPPGFRAVRASPAERALRSPRSHPSGRSGARPRLLECPLGASPSVARYPPFSVISNPVWSDMLCGRFIFLCIQTSRGSGQLQLCSVRRQRVAAVATRHGPGEDEASRRRGASRTRPALSPAHPRADPKRDIPADRHSPVARFFTFDAKRDSSLTVTPRLPIRPPRRLRRARLATRSRRETPRWSPRRGRGIPSRRSTASARDPRSSTRVKPPARWARR